VSANHKDALPIALCLCVLLISQSAVFAQLSRTETESEALATIRNATNPTLKLTAAEDFIARFPNSGARLNVAELIGAEILKIRNGAVAFALLERAQAVFTSEQEREIFKPITLEVYSLSNRTDDAFTLAAEMLSKNPADLNVLILMASIGVDQSVKTNRKLAELALQYALKAIEIVEAGHKPESVNEERWATYKSNLGLLYRNSAILYVLFHRTEEAKTHAGKACLLMPQEPSTFATLGRAIDFEYSAQLQKYEAMPDGEAKQEARKKVDALLDDLIDAFARAVGLATGLPRYQELVRVLVPPLTSYYQTRHNSTDGLRALINKYRLKP
jgi:hypothetical protein